MPDSYHLNPDKISLERFQQSLQSRELIPSRKPLKEGIEQNFAAISRAGVETMGELFEQLKSKSRLEHFSEKTGIDSHYLTLLKREAGSTMPNPVPLLNFPEVDPSALLQLENVGIKHSKQLLLNAGRMADRKHLVFDTGIDEAALDELVHLSDLVRLYGVGPAFARILYDIGVDSVQKFLTFTPVKLVRLYEEVTQKAADFSERDIAFSIEIGKELEQMIEESQINEEVIRL